MMPYNQNNTLEGRLGRIKIDIKCPHRKQNDFTYHHYKDNNVNVDAYLCTTCLPMYQNIIKGYQNAKIDILIDGDNFDDDEMCFKFPEE